MSNKPQTVLKQSTSHQVNNLHPQSFKKSSSKNGIQLMKTYLLKKAQNRYKLNLSDQEAFKWKFSKNKSNRPLTSFGLIKKKQNESLNSNTTNMPYNNNDTSMMQRSTFQFYQSLKDFSFPVLSYKTKQLADMALVILTQNQFYKQNLSDSFPPGLLHSLITQISLNYNIVSYHNFSHAFSLSLYHKQGLSSFYTQQEKYYAILAGLAHDMNHPGTNNAFQVKTKSAKALQFNNESVLQYFHLQQLWKLLERIEGINFLNKLQKAKAQQVKKRITYLILMTDVAQHFKNLEKLKSIKAQLQPTEITQINLISANTQMNKINHKSILDLPQNRQVYLFQYQFFLGQLFHASDIGNPCIDFDNYISWAALLSYQFNEQTKLQLQNNVQVTEMLRFVFTNVNHLTIKKTIQLNQQQQKSTQISQIPSLKEFLINIDQNKSVSSQQQTSQDQINHQQIDSFSSLSEFSTTTLANSQLVETSLLIQPLTYHIQTYGCQMNVNDTEIIRSILNSTKNSFAAFIQTDTAEQSNIVFLNTCAIRQSAQSKIHARIGQLKANKKVKILGLLGCMAERLKDKMFKYGVNIICGPDAYRDLPKLIDIALQKDHLQGSSSKVSQMNVQLSVEETYADIMPIRKDKQRVSAFLSIMRGCNNMCSFCIVPFVRGRQRSRDVDTILKQIQQVQQSGIKEVTFLGQNVNSYHDVSNPEVPSIHRNSEGFSEMFKLRETPGYRFSHLLQIAAKSFPDLRFRFTSPHPKDFPDDLLQTIATHDNICKYIHLPAQSGNSQILFKMRRNHTRQAYLNLVRKMKQVIPNLTLSTDLICGFCGQTEEQFKDVIYFFNVQTLTLLQEVKYENAFLFAYSMREKTHAHRNYVDNVPHQTKMQRLQRMINKFTQIQRTTNQNEPGKIHLVLIENTSKKDNNKWIGKTDNFKKSVIIKNTATVLSQGLLRQKRQIRIGDYVAVKVKTVGPRSLNCQVIAIVDKLSDYVKFQQKLKDFDNMNKSRASTELL